MAQQPVTRRNFLSGVLGTTSPVPPIPVANTSIVSSPLIGIDGHTRTTSFYRQQLGYIPQITPVFWALRLYGMVETPLTLTHDDFLTLPITETACTLSCIGNSARNPMIGHATWSGVPLASLMEQAQPTGNARYVQFYSTDGYTTYLEIEQLDEALLAYQMNGEPLPREHGYPVRLIVPGLYGYKMPKWLQRIELTDTPTPGFWEQRGWSSRGETQTTSAVFTPRHLDTVSGTIHLSGVAYGGRNAITSVEISINDSPWMPVPLASNTPYSWTPWQIDWTAPSPGDYLIKVRATDERGFTQAEATPALPNGPTAIQSIVVHIRA